MTATDGIISDCCTIDETAAICQDGWLKNKADSLTSYKHKTLTPRARTQNPPRGHCHYDTQMLKALTGPRQSLEASGGTSAPAPS